jgi:hypothetical protein
MSHNKDNCHIKGCGVCDTTAQRLLTLQNEEAGWKEDLRREYRKKTLEMAREVSISGDYSKVEGMIVDWWLKKMDIAISKAYEAGHTEAYKEMEDDGDAIAKRERVGQAIKNKEVIYLSENAYALAEDDYYSWEEWAQSVAPAGSSFEKFIKIDLSKV